MSEIMWAINSKNFGLYYGTSATRKEMIERHTTKRGITWRECRKYGDRAVKVEVRIINEKIEDSQEKPKDS